MAKSASQIATETGIGYFDAAKLVEAYSILDKVNSYSSGMERISDSELCSYTAGFRQRLSNGAKLDELMPEAFAVVKEAARRVYERAREDPGLCAEIFGEGESPKFGAHFDCQVVGGVMLHKGYVAEMKTGEGKTLVAAMPAYLNALEEKGVHIVTSNDYLAKRDAKWMSPVFNMLGISVGAIHEREEDEGMTDAHVFAGRKAIKAGRKDAYGCDITYGTSSEFGFDYLRDNIAHSLDEKVQRGHRYAIIDEVDNILIDEARTPLIRSMPGKTDVGSVVFADEIARYLIGEQRKLVDSKMAEYKAALAQLESKEKSGKKLAKEEKAAKSALEKRVKSLEYADKERKLGGSEYHNPESKSENLNFYGINLKEGKAWIDEAGLRWMEENGKIKGSYEADDINLIQYVNDAIKAHTLFHRDVHYIVDGEPVPDKAKDILELLGSEAARKKVVIVDEGTGRKMPDRRWSGGLHEAVEAKENAEIGARNMRYGEITLPFYFARYKRIAGMTGTAKPAAKEFRNLYGMDVVAIPTNKPVKRVDHNDVLYRTKMEKFEAVADEVAEWHRIGRPVLVGTASVEDSEQLAAILAAKGITDFEILNARKEYLAREAEIIAKAGRKGAITIATNMAGRGADIPLGDGVTDLGKGWKYWAEKGFMQEGVPNLGEGGLVVIGTQRHDSRRVDDQLRGRAGRQGDPGATRFYTSLEDDVMRFVPEWMRNKMGALIPEGEGIESRTLSKAIAKGQGNITANHEAQRKSLIEYDAVLNAQRNAVYGLRDRILEGEKIRGFVFDGIVSIVESASRAAIEDAYADVDKVRAGKSGFSHDFISWLEKRHQKGEEAASYSTYAGYLLEKRVERAFGAKAFVPELREIDIKDAKSFPNGAGVTLVDAAKAIKGEYLRKRQEIGAAEFDMGEANALIRCLDEQWMGHLEGMDELKKGIHYRAFAQVDPKIAYGREGKVLFDEMMCAAVTNAISIMMSQEEKQAAKASA